MTSRRRPIPFEALILLAARLPWWLSLLLALSSGWLLHGYASSLLPFAGDTARQASPTLAGALYVLVLLAQYVLPLLLLGAAAAALFGRARRAKRLSALVDSPPSGIASLDQEAFEQMLGSLFSHKGFEVVELDGVAQGGADLHLLLGRERYLVQYRHWRSGKVGLAALHELFATMVALEVAGGFIVSTGRYSEDARAFARGRNIQLIDGMLLESWLAEQRRPTASPDVLGEYPGVVAVPFCPLCNASMVLRTAKRGANAGTCFWGCRRYPVCHGLRRVE